MVRLPTVSPDSQRVAYIVGDDDSLAKTLYVANVDGSNVTSIYTQTLAYDSTDQNAPYLSWSDSLIWNRDSTKVAMIDGRQQAPIWVFNLGANTFTKVWPGRGWETGVNPIDFTDFIPFDD
jgi:hypothetical protein